MISDAVNLFLILAAGYLLAFCANPVTPSGGPKDTEPPKFLKSYPQPFSRNFKENKIKITFDEFIQLKNLNEQVIISPPMITAPNFKLKGKSLIIEINDVLKENTTYNIFFGNSIVDLTENNPLENFQFVFSTGNVIDSLTIAGEIYNAFDLKPVKNVSVMLYAEGNDTIVFDSLPYFIKPYYMTKTNESGKFSLRNLAGQSYKIFALLDLNGNLMYDQPGESIGFVKELVDPYYVNPDVQDSLFTDSIQNQLPISINTTEYKIKFPLFQEIDSAQRLLKTVVPQNYQVNLIFKRPVTDLIIQPVDINTTAQWAKLEYNTTRDTIVYWIINPERDSVKLEVRDGNTILDTVKISILKRVKGKKAEAENLKLRKLEIKNNIKGGLIDLNKPLILTFGYPIKSIDSSGFRMFENDTIPVDSDYGFADSVNRKIIIDHKWKKSTSYSLLISDSNITDIHNHKNDSTLINFRSKSPEDYGNLFIQVQLPETGVNHIIQLISGEKIIREAEINSNGKISFTHLIPGKYQLKMIEDLNTNGKWDTGNYIYNIQPENVRFFPLEITVRANWDIEEEWSVETQ